MVSSTGAAAAEEEEPAPGGEADWIEPLDEMRRVANEEATGGWVEPSAKNFKVRGPNYLVDRIKFPSRQAVFRPIGLHTYRRGECLSRLLPCLKRLPVAPGGSR